MRRGELRLPNPESELCDVTRVQVTNESTLQAARRLVDDGMRPLSLNPANGVNPGGGFLHGAHAQEEALCRSSALFQTLVGDPMYDHHRDRPHHRLAGSATHSTHLRVRGDGQTVLVQYGGDSVDALVAKVGNPLQFRPCHLD